MEALDLRKIRSELEEFFEKAGLNFENQMNATTLEFRGHFKVFDCDDDVALRFTVWSDCNAIFSAVFDKLEITPAHLDLINKFNNSAAHLKAYVALDDNYLVIKNSSYGINPDVLTCVKAFLSDLVCPELRPFIEVFCGLTTSD